MSWRFLRGLEPHRQRVVQDQPDEFCGWPNSGELFVVSPRLWLHKKCTNTTTTSHRTLGHLYIPGWSILSIPMVGFKLVLPAELALSDLTNIYLVWQQYRRIYGRRGDENGWKGGAQEGVPTVIPRNLLPGKYLLRSEAVYVYPDIPDLKTLEWFQLYATCAQLDVVGKGTKLPDKEYLVSFPGAYKNDDKGLKVYKDYPVPYEFPGPKLWTGE